MSRRKRYRDPFELIRQTTAMGSQLARKDPEYALFTGGALETNSQIAILHAVKKTNILGIYKGLSKEDKANYDFILKYLQVQRKAEFGCFADMLTKLALALGDTRFEIDVGAED